MAVYLELFDMYLSQFSLYSIFSHNLDNIFKSLLI